MEQKEYVPDFVAETATTLYLLEPKANNEVNTPEVQEKRNAAEFWCQHATAHALTYGGKPWRYLLLPHDLIAENMTLARLVAQV